MKRPQHMTISELLALSLAMPSKDDGVAARRGLRPDGVQVRYSELPAGPADARLRSSGSTRGMLGAVLRAFG